MKLSFEAQLTKVESKADHTCKLILGTQELGETAGQLMNIAGEQISVLFVTAGQTVTEEDIPDVPQGQEYGNKTPAQLQRAILYRIWEARGKAGTFEAYYRMRMSKNEQLLKDELDGLTI